MGIEDLKQLLYLKFGAFSKQALGIIKLAVDNNIDSLHVLAYESGISFRLVREIVYALEQEIELSNDKFLISEQLKKMITNERFESEVNSEKLMKSLTEIVERFSHDNANLDHISALPETCFQRARLLLDKTDVQNCKILFVGDHDFTSLSVAMVAKELNISCTLYVVDLDDNVLSFIEDISREYGLAIITTHSDFRFSIPNNFIDQMDIVFTDPPYTPEGMGVFLNRSIQCLRNNPFSTIYISYKSAEMSNYLGVSVQKEIIKRNLYISEVLPNFNHYYAAEAIGYRSDLYVCRVTPKSYKYLEKAEYTNKMYTHGVQSVENSSENIELDSYLESIIDGDYTLKIHLIFSSNNIKNKINANKVSFRRYVDNVIEGKSYINTNGSKIFVDYTGFSDSYKFRPLLLMGFDEYFCLFTKGQAALLKQKESSILSFINSCYDIKEETSQSNLCLYRFKQKEILDEESKFILFMLLNARSKLRNSFAKVAAKFLGLPKNDARKLYDESGLENEKDSLMFNLSEQSIKQLIVAIKKLDLNTN